MKIDYEKRIDVNSFTEESLYIRGLIDIVDFLVQELKIFLKEEGRFFGLAKSYIDSIENTLKNINVDIEPEDLIIFGKILYLYKPLILSEFKRLKNKRLSSGDSVICIIKKLTDIICEKDEENIKGVKTIKKLIYKFFDNIRNKAKNDPLYYFSNFIKTNLEKGYIGIFETNSFSLRTNEIVKEVFEGDNIKLEENENSISEITWIGEK